MLMIQVSIIFVQSNLREWLPFLSDHLYLSKTQKLSQWKPYKVLGVIKRSLGSDNRYAFSRLFKSLVRPVLEYAAPVWSPYQKKDIESLEKVQRRTSRLALKQKRGEMSYEVRCRLLNWQTLEKRREFLSLV